MAVRKIEFAFDNESLFGGTHDVSLLDVESSAEKYARLCRSELQREYPDADISIEHRYDPERDELLSVAQSLVIDGDVYSEEVGNVKAIVERIHGQGSWMLQKNWLEISDASSRSGIPRSHLHWMCEHKVFSGARKVRGVWKLTPQELNNFSRHHDPVNHGFDVLRASRTDDDSWEITFDSATLLTVNIGELITDTIVVQQTEAVHSVFTNQNSRIVIGPSTDQLVISVEHFYDEDSWPHPKWKREAYLLQLLEQAKNSRFNVARIELMNSSRIGFLLFGSILLTDMNRVLRWQMCSSRDFDVLKKLVQDNEIVLAGGRAWKSEYESNERQFCLDLLLPLLKQLGFGDVNYRGGPKEYGKDFTFSEQMVFGGYRYYGLQAKDGDMSGKVNSAIDEIIGQLDDAFGMPYKEGENKKDRYISHFVVAISGYYKDNALDKIREKIPKHWKPMVSFWDKTKIQELSRKAWLQEKRHDT